MLLAKLLECALRLLVAIQGAQLHLVDYDGNDLLPFCILPMCCQVDCSVEKL